MLSKLLLDVCAHMCWLTEIDSNIEPNCLERLHINQVIKINRVLRVRIKYPSQTHNYNAKISVRIYSMWQ